MNKDLSQEERGTLASEFTYQGKKSGMLGGYCEADFPLYYANEEMAELLGYGSVEELAAGIGGRVANTIHPDDMPRVEKDLNGHFYEGMTYETTYRMLRRDGNRKIRSRIIFSKICRVGMSAAASARVFRSSISASDF